MIKSLFRDRLLLILLLTAIILRLFALQPAWVEQYYANGAYPVISRIMRSIFGSIPFSFGDLLYLAAAVFLILKVWKLFRLLRRRQLRQYVGGTVIRRYARRLLWVYLVFTVLWGMNYFRKGIGDQLSLDASPYAPHELFELTIVLQQRLNQYAALVDTTRRQEFETDRRLFDGGKSAFDRAARKFPFLAFRTHSMKSSMLSSVGHYFGFTGYYNPFTGEAQLNTTVPVFVRPFIVNHEIAHQLGYAKEDEASFVSYLASREYDDIDFLYSVYYNLYRDAIFQCARTGNRDVVRAIRKNLHPQVKRDNRELRAYLLGKKNVIEPLISDVYDSYLKLNNQPKGKATYDEVIALLISFMKKYGKEAV